jgi:hypothetical protein
MMAMAQGTVRADDGAQTVLRVNFTADEPTKIVAPDHAATAVLTSDPAETVGGKRALKGDSRTSTVEWNEFFHSRTGIFKPHTAYRIGFDYRVIACVVLEAMGAMTAGPSGRGNREIAGTSRCPTPFATQRTTS